MGKGEDRRLRKITCACNVYFDPKVHREWALDAFVESTGLELKMAALRPYPRSELTPLYHPSMYAWIAEEEAFKLRGRDHLSQQVQPRLVSEVEWLQRCILKYQELSVAPPSPYSRGCVVSDSGVTRDLRRNIADLGSLEKLLTKFIDRAVYTPPARPSPYMLPSYVLVQCGASLHVAVIGPTTLWDLRAVVHEDRRAKKARLDRVVAMRSKNGTRKGAGGPREKAWQRRDLVRRLLTVRRAVEDQPVPSRYEVLFRRFARVDPQEILEEESAIDAILCLRVAKKKSVEQKVELERGFLLELQEVALLLMALEAHVGPENETGPAAVEEETRPTPALHLERLERAVADDWKRIREDLKLAGAEVGAGATCAASDFLPAVAARSNRPSAKEAAQNRNRERRYRGADRRKTMADDEKPGAHDCGGGLRRVPRVAYFAADRKGLRGLLERLSASGYKVNRLEPTLKACSALPGSPPDMIVADLTLMAAQVRGVLAALSKSQFTRDIPTVVVGAAADELKLARDAAPQAREFYKGPVKLEELVDILGRPRPGAVSPERAKRIR